jgi:hypothetical protein
MKRPGICLRVRRMRTRLSKSGERAALRLSGQSFARSGAGVDAHADHTFREAACRLSANEQNEAMNAFHNAAKSYKKSDPEGASHRPAGIGD